MNTAYMLVLGDFTFRPIVEMGISNLQYMISGAELEVWT